MTKLNGWQALGFETYQEYLMSDLWLEKRDYILKLFPYCGVCKAKATQVHHISYGSVGNEDGDDVVSICRPCHQEFHNSKLEWDKFIQEKREKNGI